MFISCRSTNVTHSASRFWNSEIAYSKLDEQCIILNYSKKMKHVVRFSKSMNKISYPSLGLLRLKSIHPMEVEHLPPISMKTENLPPISTYENWKFTSHIYLWKLKTSLVLSPHCCFVLTNFMITSNDIRVYAKC